MKKLLALTLVLAFSLAVFAPMPASAGASTDAALALGAFAVLNQIARGQTIFNGPYGYPPYPVYGPQPVYAPYPVYAPPMYYPVMTSGCSPEYGYVYNDPYNPGIPRYVPTGRVICR